MLGLQQGAESVHHHQPVPSMQPTGGQFSEMFLCSTPTAEWLLVQGNSFFFVDNYQHLQFSTYTKNVTKTQETLARNERKNKLEIECKRNLKGW